MTRKMKSSGIEWIGDIPEEWEVIKLKYISCFYNGFSFDSNNLVTDYIYPVIRIGDIKGDDVNFNSSLGVKDDFGLSSYLIKDNDILLAMSGATVGKVGFVEKSIKSYINQRVGIIRTSLPHFVFYNLLTKNFMEYINIRAEGSAQPNISSKMIENFSIAYPKKDLIFEITNRIKNKIRIVNDTVKLINNQIENLENYKKSVITEAVTKGLDKNVEMKDSGIEWIGETPKHWKVIRIKNAALLKARIGWQGLRSDEFLTDSGLPYLVTGTDFNNGYVDWDNCVRISEKRFEMDKNIQIKENDLLITKDGTIGKLAIARNCPNKASLNSGVFVMRNQGPYKYMDKYMYYLLQSEQFYLWFELNDAGNSTIRHLYQKGFYNFSFTYPELKEQEKIVSYLDKKTKLIDDSTSLKRKQLETLEEYKKSLIYEYVTGKKEVTDGEGI